MPNGIAKLKAKIFVFMPQDISGLIKLMGESTKNCTDDLFGAKKVK